MPEDPVRPPSELRLALRRQLEDMFRSLDLVHDEIEVTSQAARSEGAHGDRQGSHLLRMQQVIR